jgi:ArsR family transcriptional regulator
MSAYAARHGGTRMVSAMGKKAKALKGTKTGRLAPDEPAVGGRGEPKGGMAEKQVLQISKAIADPRRMAMLRMIAQGASTCGGLMECTGVSAATLSHHMKELETAGVIETTKDGRLLQATLHKKAWKSYVASLKAIGG